MCYVMHGTQHKEQFYRHFHISFSIIFTVRRFASVVLAVVLCLSVHVSIHHMQVLYQNSRIMQTMRHDGFQTPKILAKFEWGNPQWGAKCRWVG